MLKISLLTPFTLQQEDQPITLTSRRTEALFVYLLRTAQPQAREVLANLFWDDLPQTQAAGNLRVLIANLHKAVGAHVTITRQSIAFDHKSAFRCDLTDLERTLAQMRTEQVGTESLSKTSADQLAQALASYQGELLPGFYLRGGQGFDEWLATEREWLWTRAIAALSDLTTAYLRLGDYRAGIAQAQRLVKLDPLREEGHQQLMQLLAADGQNNAALAHYQRAVQILAAELGVSPSLATTQLFQQIQHGEWRRPMLLANIAAAPPTIAHNLPRPLTPFVGRTTELAQLAHLLETPTTPLITIVGAGGMGKTALAIEAARQLLAAPVDAQAAYRDGIFLVPLAAISEVVAIPVAIAEAIGFRFQKDGGDERAQLLGHLARQSLLLILDSFEHLLNENDLIADLLQAALKLRLLVTSRHNLNLHGASVLRLAGMELPEEKKAKGDENEHILYSSAVQLFVQSVRRSHGPHDFSAADLSAIARICQLVQGMPLAILLAASWVETHTFAEIASEIAQNVAFLTTTEHDLPERQRSIKAVFDYSWQLLSVDEQRVFARMSIFRGGCTRLVAQQVTGGSSQHLLALEHKSRIQRDLASGRFTIHALLRQLAASKLTTLGESPTPLHALAVESMERLYTTELTPHVSELAYHAEQAGLTTKARHYLQMAGDVARDGFQNSLAIDYYSRALALTVANDNDGDFSLLMARQTLYHLLGKRQEQAWDLDALENLSTRLLNRRRPIEVMLEKARYFETISDYAKAVSTAQQAAQFAEDFASPDLLCKSHLIWGQCLWRLGDLQAAQFRLERALIEVQSISDPQTEATILRSLGIVFEFKWNYVEAQRYYFRSLEICRQIGNRQGEVSNLNNLGVVAFYQHDLTACQRYLLEALPIRRMIGDRRGEAHALHNLGSLLATWGDFAGSRQYAEQSLLIFREVGDRWGEADAQHRLGSLLAEEKHYPLAENLYCAGLTIAQQIGYQRCIALTLCSLGHLARQQDQLARAKQLYEATLIHARQANFTGYALEASAGLAMVALLQGQPTEAQKLANQVLAALDEEALSQAEEPFRIYYECYRVLHETQNSQTSTVIKRAYDQLQQRALQITDETLRHSSWQNVAIHRAIIAEFEN